MVRFENVCVDCATPGYPCLRSLCPLTKVPHYYCDWCKEEADIYHYNNEQVCLDCIAKDLGKVEI